MKKKIALALAGIMMIAGLAGCGKDDSTSNPSSGSGVEKDTVAPATEEEPSENPDEEDVTEGGSALHEGEILVGSFDGNVYTNDLFGFKLEVDGSTWMFYDDATIASAAGVTESEITQLRSGELSPYDLQVSYCMIAYDSTTGTNVIVNYFCPEQYGISGITATEYLEMGSSAYPGSVVSETQYLGRTYGVLDIPEEEGAGYAQRMYAAEQDGLIVMITFTVLSGDSIDSIASMLKSM